MISTVVMNGAPIISQMTSAAVTRLVTLMTMSRTKWRNLAEFSSIVGILEQNDEEMKVAGFISTLRQHPTGKPTVTRPLSQFQSQSQVLSQTQILSQIQIQHSPQMFRFRTSHKSRNQEDNHWLTETLHNHTSQVVTSTPRYSTTPDTPTPTPLHSPSMHAQHSHTYTRRKLSEAGVNIYNETQWNDWFFVLLLSFIRFLFYIMCLSSTML